MGFLGDLLEAQMAIIGAPKRAGNALGDALIGGLGRTASDVYWTATNPVDRILGRGRAANPLMEFPGGGSFAARRALASKLAKDAQIRNWADTLPSPESGAPFVASPPGRVMGGAWNRRIPILKKGDQFIVGRRGMEHRDLSPEYNLGVDRQFELILPRKIKGEAIPGQVQIPWYWDDMARQRQPIEAISDYNRLRTELTKKYGAGTASRMTKRMQQWLLSDPAQRGNITLPDLRSPG